MPRGRKPKPTHLKVLTGNPGKRPLNENEPKPREALHAPPSHVHLTDDELNIWTYYLAQCPPGLLTTLDVGVFQLWVKAFAAFQKAERLIEKAGAPLRAVRDPATGEVVGMEGNPLYESLDKQRSNAAAMMLRAGSLMGFDPTSRPRLHVTPTGGGEAGESAPDPWARFQGR